MSEDNFLSGGNDKKRMPDIFLNPFSKECVSCISIYIYPGDECRAYVDFINGNTKGQQEFKKYNDFKKMLDDIEAFVNTLSNGKNRDKQ